MGEIVKVSGRPGRRLRVDHRGTAQSRIEYGAIRLDTRDEFIRAIGEYAPDMILSGHELPQFNSLEALKICRQQNRITATRLTCSSSAAAFLFSWS